MPNHHRHRSSGTVLMVPLAAVVALLHLWTTVAAKASPSPEPPMGLLPHCPTMCGNVTVPYPFGIRDGCFLPGFNLTCDSTQDPPRLLLGAGTGAGEVQVQVTAIFLQNASMRVMSGAILDHTAADGARGTWGSFLDGRGRGRGGGDSGGGGPSPFVLSYHRNKLFAVGCDIQATLLHGNGTQLVAGCSSFCTVDGKGHVLSRQAGANGCHRCSGNGCCKASIPLYHPSYDVRLKSLEPTPTWVDSGGLPKLVFIGEQDQIDELWCQFYRGSLFPRSPRQEQPVVVPVLLEWAMASTAPRLPGLEKDNASRCPLDRASSACKSRYSNCIDMNSPFRSGYSCRCLPGYHGNPYLEDGCQDINECEDPEHHQCYGECTNFSGTYECRCPRGSHGNSSMMHGCVKSSTGQIIALGLASGATVLVLAISTTLLVHKVKVETKKRLKQRFFKQNHGKLLQQLLVCQRADIGERMIITLEELEKATNNFDKSRELGGGGHGIVYKGILSSQHVVAIKKAKIMIQKEINDFINEVAILSQVNHRNIVKLLGCCLETEAPLLVYEFISNHTLYKHLHVRAPTSISWKNRLRIAVEIARALTYLHSLVSTPIVHRDVKSPNILLDDNLTVKLSDFGASRYIPIDEEGIHTTVQGTLGYLDPMYHSTGLLTEKSDVYSFGVLLIELLTRENPNCYRSHQGFALVNHFSSLVSQGNLVEILDPQVTKEGDGEVVDVALLAAICVKFRAEERPMMRHVEMTLESIQSAKEFSSDVTDDDISSEDNIPEEKLLDVLAGSFDLASVY